MRFSLSFQNSLLLHIKWIWYIFTGNHSIQIGFALYLKDIDLLVKADNLPPIGAYYFLLDTFHFTHSMTQSIDSTGFWV